MSGTTPLAVCTPKLMTNRLSLFWGVPTTRKPIGLLCRVVWPVRNGVAAAEAFAGAPPLRDVSEGVDRARLCSIDLDSRVEEQRAKDAGRGAIAHDTAQTSRHGVFGHQRDVGA